MAFQPPMFEALCYTNAELRQGLAALVCGEGVVDVGAGDLEVTTGGAGLTLFVAPGGAYIAGTQDPPDQGMYRVRNDAQETVTATTADATNPRIDQVVVRVRDAEYGGLNQDVVVEVVEGTPTSGADLSNLDGADDLSTYDNVIRLAYVLTPATFTGPYVDATHILDARDQMTLCGAGGWQDYTPTLTNITAMDLSARYSDIGGMIVVEIQIQVDTMANDPEIELPFEIRDSFSAPVGSDVLFIQNSTGDFYPLMVVPLGPQSLGLFGTGSTPPITQLTTAHALAMTTDDVVTIHYAYERA